MERFSELTPDTIFARCFSLSMLGPPLRLYTNNNHMKRLLLVALLLASSGFARDIPTLASDTELQPMPTPTPLSSEKLKDIAMLVNSPKAEWFRSLGEPDRELPPGNTLPRDAGETDCDLRTIEMNVLWLQTKEGILPWDIRFLHINGEPDAFIARNGSINEVFRIVPIQKRR